MVSTYVESAVNAKQCNSYMVGTMIRAIPQRNNYDCAFATVAMAADTTYDMVAALIQRFIWRPKAGLTTNEQLFLLQQLTGEVWESWVAPPRQRLVDFQVNVHYEPGDGEDDDSRFLLSTYRQRAGRRSYWHSLFCDGRRIFDPMQGIWIPFNKLRRIPRYRNVYISELLTQQGTVL